MNNLEVVLSRRLLW